MSASTTPAMFEEVPAWRMESVAVHAFGKPINYYVEDWVCPRSFANIAKKMHSLGIVTSLMPKPSFNGVCILRGDAFTKALWSESCFICTGVRADAVILKRGRAAAWASGDCHTVVIYNRASGEAAMIHGGRFALLPKHLRPRRTQRNGGPCSNEDVIATTVHGTSWDPRQLSVYITTGIGPGNFLHPLKHPEHGARNRAMLAYLRNTYGSACTPGPKCEGRIDVPALISRICTSLGIREEEIQHDMVDTFADSTRWWSNRRGDTCGRNLVIVQNLR